MDIIKQNLEFIKRILFVDKANFCTEAILLHNKTKEYNRHIQTNDSLVIKTPNIFYMQ